MLNSHMGIRTDILREAGVWTDRGRERQVGERERKRNKKKERKRVRVRHLLAWTCLEGQRDEGCVSVWSNSRVDG